MQAENKNSLSTQIEGHKILAIRREVRGALCRAADKKRTIVTAKDITVSLTTISADILVRVPEALIMASLDVMAHVKRRRHIPTQICSII